MTRTRLGSVLLDFSRAEDDADAFLEDMSAVCAAGPSLWLASDETNQLHRLTLTDGDRYGDHQVVDLWTLFDLPDRKGDNGKVKEIDIEGVCLDAAMRNLWILGSHARRRPRPKLEKHGTDEALARLADVKSLESEPNRLFLGRIALDRSAQAADEFGVERSGCAALAVADGSNQLLNSLQADEHIAPFLALPAKDNGLDLEGIGAQGGELYLGCRGPVVGGWAVVLTVVPKGGQGGVLKLKKQGDAGARHRKRFLDLDGLGIRDLTFDGDDLLILAGPPTTLDGPFGIYRWHRPGDEPLEPFVSQGASLQHLYTLPPGSGRDYAEGIAVIPWRGTKAILIVHDRPARSRLRPGATLEADVFPMV